MADMTIDQETHEYELVYILQPEISEDGVLGVNDRIAQIVGSHSGEIAETEMWGRRTLAYPIKKQFEGHYVLQRLSMFPDGTDEVERYLRFNEDVLRFLLMRSDS
jgi:small subunit ribosomal protein S6